MSATKDRVLAVAIQSFGTRGYDGTSLDAVAAEVGLAKQSVLYYFPSKQKLFVAAVERGIDEFADIFNRALLSTGSGWERIESLVKDIFLVATRQPALLGLVREASRPDSPAVGELSDRFGPVVEQARGFLRAEIDAGNFRPADPNLLLLSLYSTVFGVATEIEVLRTIGVEPTLRSAVVRRAELLRFLRAAVLP